MKLRTIAFTHYEISVLKNILEKLNAENSSCDTDGQKILSALVERFDRQDTAEAVPASGFALQAQAIPDELHSLAHYLWRAPEHAYLIDMDTYAIIYMNKIAMERHGFPDASPLPGVKCHMQLQKNPAPCFFCTSTDLKPWVTAKSLFYSDVTDEDFILRNTMLTVGAK